MFSQEYENIESYIIDMNKYINNLSLSVKKSEEIIKRIHRLKQSIEPTLKEGEFPIMWINSSPPINNIIIISFYFPRLLSDNYHIFKFFLKNFFKFIISWKNLKFILSGSIEVPAISLNLGNNTLKELDLVKYNPFMIDLSETESSKQIEKEDILRYTKMWFNRYIPNHGFIFKYVEEHEKEK